MRAFSTIFCLGWLLLCSAAQAQDKVAEGEYEMRSVSESGAQERKTVIRWQLTARGPAGYHLRSEILGMPDGKRFFQIEDLDAQLVPTAVGYQGQEQGKSKPSASLHCEFAGGSITCSGESEQQPSRTCKPYKYSGAFWLWLNNLFMLDLPWLMDGAVNMAHLEKGEASIAMIRVASGEAEGCDFKIEEESTLGLVGAEEVEVGEQKVASKHYIMKDGEEPIHVWTVGPGLLAKMTNKENGEFVLANFKQYRKLIPGLPVEEQHPGQPAKTK